MNKKQTKKIQLKEKKLNFVLIRNGKILLIFFCLQAKLQLFQDNRARGVFRGAMVPWPLQFGRQDSIISIE